MYKYIALWAGMQIKDRIDYKRHIEYTKEVNIEFVPSSRDAELIVPAPKPAKIYVPDWYKNIKNDKDLSFDDNGTLLNRANGVKRCMPFLDGTTAGYIQESWTDIYIKNLNGKVQFSFPIGPKIMEMRENISISISNMYYPVEFLWQMHWLPKLPSGWSVMITSPQNRLDLPFRSLAGVIDSDYFYHMGISGGNYPFYIQNGFEGLIPAGTPMYQIIPFKRENWNSHFIKFDEDDSFKKVASFKKYIINGYKRVFWQKKSYN